MFAIVVKGFVRIVKYSPIIAQIAPDVQGDERRNLPFMHPYYTPIQALCNLLIIPNNVESKWALHRNEIAL